MKSPFSHIMIAVAVCIAAIAGYGMWYAAISAKSASVAALQNQIDTKTETVNRIAAARATLANVASDESVVQNYFVPEAGVVSFIDALETSGKTLGSTVSVQSVGTSGTPAKPSLELALSVKGTFDAVMRTVGSIEYAPYDLSISSLTITQDDKNIWHADLKIVVGSVPVAKSSSVAPIPSTAFAPSISSHEYF
ncbi:MAG: hypothetical protein WCT41_00895 [Candidatus Paceibacterota bacterium]|jgi:hypothetical protein